jgi:hypothetical protein
MFHLFHVLYPDRNRKNMMRTLLCGSLPENIIYHIIAPKNDNEHYLKEHKFLHAKYIYYCSNMKEVLNILIKRKNIISGFIALDLWNYKWLLPFGKPIFFIQHGIRGSFIISKIIDGYKSYVKERKHSQKGLQQIYTCGMNELICLQKANVPSERYTMLYGLPQTDYIFYVLEKIKENKKLWMEKMGFSSNKKYFFLLPSMYNYCLFVNDLVKIIRKQMPSDVEILFKYKTDRYQKKYPEKFQGVTCIPHDHMIYNYFFADYYIILGYGSAYLETLFITDKVLLYTGKCEEKISQKENMFLEPLGKLLIINDETKLEESFKKLQSDSYFDEEYENNKRELFKKEIGNETFQKVTSLIASDIVKQLQYE